MQLRCLKVLGWQMWQPTGVKVKAGFLNGKVHIYQLCHNIIVVILESGAADYYLVCFWFHVVPICFLLLLVPQLLKWMHYLCCFICMYVSQIDLSFASFSTYIYHDIAFIALIPWLWLRSEMVANWCFWPASINLSIFG